MTIPVYINGISINDDLSNAKGAYGIYWSDESSKNLIDYVIFDTHDYRAQLHVAIRAMELAIDRNVENIVIYTKLHYLTNVLADMEIENLMKNGWIDKNGDFIENHDLLKRILKLKSYVHFIVLPPPTHNMSRIQTMTKNLSSIFGKFIHH